MATLFHTDREEAEAWFAFETRELPMPDGTILRTPTAASGVAFDFII